MTSGVYAIRNGLTGEQYIGQSQDIAQRWTGHQSLLRKGRHPSRGLQEAWNRHDTLCLDVLEPVEWEQLTARERHWIATLKPAYNTSPGVSKQAQRAAQVMRLTITITGEVRTMLQQLMRRRYPGRAGVASLVVEEALRRLYEAEVTQR